MTCRKCGIKIKKEDKFCYNCGQKILSESEIVDIEKEVVDEVENGELTTTDAEKKLFVLKKLNIKYPGQFTGTIKRLKKLFDEKNILIDKKTKILNLLIKVMKNWKMTLNITVVIVAIFFMIAYAPFGFWFGDTYDVQELRIVTIFLSTILLLYILRK